MIEQKIKNQLLKIMSSQCGSNIIEINLISWDMIEPFINELESTNKSLLEAAEAVMNEYYHDRLRLNGDLIAKLQSSISNAKGG